MDKLKEILFETAMTERDNLIWMMQHGDESAEKIEALAYALATGGIEQPPARTHFERIKAAGTPEAMTVELNANARRFCPKEYAGKPPDCIIPCGECIAKWLREEAEK